MSLLRPLAFVALTVIATTTADAAGPAYVGTWGVSAAQCQVPQDQQGAPMIVTRKGYDQNETHCKFTSVRKSGDVWRIAAMCSVQGDRQKHAFALKSDGATLIMTEKQRPRAFIRCR
jgi:hypothetical protein